MAGKKAEIGKEYKKLLEAMTQELEGGCEPDELSLNQLRTANKNLMRCGKHEKKGLKRKFKEDESKRIRLNASLAVWKDVLYRLCQQKALDVHEFQTTFTMKGLKGFEKFVMEIQHLVFRSIDKEEGLMPEEKMMYKEEFSKPKGWIQNIPNDMKHQIWENLVNNLDSSKIVELGIPAMYHHKRDLLGSWSKELFLARDESNVKYANKVVELGNIHIQSTKRDPRPSLCIPGVRSLYFLRPEQIKNIKSIGGGVQGNVHTCNIVDCPPIPKNTLLVAKRFKEGDRHRKRADALQEVLMGGLNHRGIVGAMGITIQDPPRLVYDHYNGGDLRSFIDRCEKWNRSKGKSEVEDLDFKFIQEKKLFLENRLARAMALLETMQFLHDHERVHCDFHEGNILLHFDYEDDVPIKVYIGICDFGMSRTFSQCRQQEHHMWITPPDKVTNFLKKFPQFAPELVGPKPLPYSIRTDVYSMGNILDTLLTEDWDGMTKFNRFLGSGWKAQNDSQRLNDMIATMMDKVPAKRMDCGHWALKMKLAFPDCKLYSQNSPYLRD